MTELIDTAGKPLAARKVKDRIAKLQSGEVEFDTPAVDVPLPDRSGLRSNVMLTPRHATDPKQALLDQIGDISEIKVFHNLVLVAIYHRPATMMFGAMEIEVVDKTLREDEWQGTVGLVLKKGPAAFRDDATKTFYGDNVEVGDWVFFDAASGPRLKVKGVNCRRFEDIFICGTIPHPDYVY